MEGFEPPNTGTRNQCLTTWRHPNNVPTNCTLTEVNAQGVYRLRCLHFLGALGRMCKLTVDLEEEVATNRQEDCPEDNTNNESDNT